MKEKEIKEEFVSSSGSPYYTPVDYKYSEDDKCFIPIQGKTINRYEMIQASTPATDINYIVKRALAGDITALHVNNSTYADISDIPDNLNDMHNLVNIGINGFYKMSKEFRDIFDNDFEKFSEAVNDNSYIDTINKYVDSKNLENDNVEKKESEK